ncbi:MAG: GH15 family glucan-1,4-alpha-glucosidase [Flavobacteriales bacterium]|jgi:GH15 family glucan-1,4-alpha-glucosidase
MTPYDKAIDLLNNVATERGFLASAKDIANYQRVWARDAVICGLAGLLDGDAILVEAMKQTLITLADNQHERGMIPSNVYFDGDVPSISFGGLAGRVDTVAWYIIGVCQYAYKTGDTNFFKTYQSHIKKGLELQHSWEYNDGDLMNVPRSGNWADEYPTQGFILYDQLLRLWGIRCYLHFEEDVALREKATRIEKKITANYKQNTENLNPYHPKAFEGLAPTPYWVASLEPAGYQTQFDAFANSLSLLLGIGTTSDRSQVIVYAESVRASVDVHLVPAFWPVITEKDRAWQDLVNNCKYEFRNYPYEFHNGGAWQMVNGFYGLGLITSGKLDLASDVLAKIHTQNEKENWSFYENFNSETGAPNGVSFCAWSAAAAVLVQQSLNNNTLLT